MKLIEWNYNSSQYMPHYIEMAESFTKAMLPYDTMNELTLPNNNREAQWYTPISQLKKEKMVVLFIEDNGNICGYLMLRPLSNTIVFVTEFFIKEEYRSKGLGTESLLRCKQWARKKQYVYIALGVSANNRIAYNTYKKCGFVDDSIRMRCKL